MWYVSNVYHFYIYYISKVRLDCYWVKNEPNKIKHTLKEDELFDYIGYEKYYGIVRHNELDDDYEKYKDDVI